MHTTKPTTTAKRTARPLLDAADVAANLPHGSTSTVRQWFATGALASRRIGRRRVASRADVAAFLGLEESEIVTAGGA